MKKLFGQRCVLLRHHAIQSKFERSLFQEELASGGFSLERGTKDEKEELNQEDAVEFVNLRNFF